VIEDNYHDGPSRPNLEGGKSSSYKSNEDTPSSQVNPIDPANPIGIVGPIDNRVLQPFSGALDLEHYFRVVANDEGESESPRDTRIHSNS
jgi:hypothetical protein